MSAASSVPTPAQVYGARVPRRVRVFDASAKPSEPAAQRARALAAAQGAAEDLAAATLLLRRDGYERYVDLNIERLDRAWKRAQTAMRELLQVLDNADVPAPTEGGLPPADPPAHKAGT